jgi:hypothetical protein
MPDMSAYMRGFDTTPVLTPLERETIGVIAALHERLQSEAADPSFAEDVPLAEMIAKGAMQDAVIAHGRARHGDFRGAEDMLMETAVDALCALIAARRRGGRQ